MVHRNFGNKREELISKIPLIELGDMSQDELRSLRTEVGLYYNEFEREIRSILNPDQLLDYVSDKRKNYNQFRIKYDLGQHELDANQKDMLYKAILIYKNTRIVEDLLDEKPREMACDMLNDVERNLETDSRIVLRRLISDCDLPILKSEN